MVLEEMGIFLIAFWETNNKYFGMGAAGDKPKGSANVRENFIHL